jgi:hypothetical protein
VTPPGGTPTTHQSPPIIHTIYLLIDTVSIDAMSIKKYNLATRSLNEEDVVATGRHPVMWSPYWSFGRSNGSAKATLSDRVLKTGERGTRQDVGELETDCNSIRCKV